MTGLLICAAVLAAFIGIWIIALQPSERVMRAAVLLCLALIAVALWLAYAAGSQP